jgi:hypothetical protein
LDRLKGFSKGSGVITVTVKLYGALPCHVAGYDSQAGITVHVEEGTTYEHLIGILRLPPEEARVIIAGGVSRRARDTIGDHEEISFFLPMMGS